MIKSITLENFQSHKDTTFHFTDGVNAIVGITDAGKTACIRALRWVLTNRPGGEAFINHDAIVDGKQKLAVNVTIITDKHTVKRTKSATENSYTLDNTVFKAIGSDVPEEVLEALNTNDLTVQFQMDAPFLLTETSGEVARRLNRVVKLEDIDATMKQLESHRRKVKRDKDTASYEINDLEEKLQKLDYTDIKGTLDLAEMLVEAHGGFEQSLLSLSTIIDELYAVEDILASENRVKKYAKLVLKGEVLIPVITESTKAEEVLTTLIEQYSEVEDYISSKAFLSSINVSNIQGILDSYKELNTTCITIDSLLGQYANIKDNPVASIDISKYDKAVQTYRDNGFQIEDLDTLLDDLVILQKDYNKRTVTIEKLTEELGNTCPLCGGKL